MVLIEGLRVGVDEAYDLGQRLDYLLLLLISLVLGVSSGSCLVSVVHVVVQPFQVLLHVFLVRRELIVQKIESLVYRVSLLRHVRGYLMMRQIAQVLNNGL